MNLELQTTNLTNDIKNLIASAQEKAIRTVDYQRVLLYWNIGKRIFEEVQGGEARAEYGKSIIKNLSSELEPVYGSGYGVRQLELMRQFYRIFPIANTLYSQLNWSQYKLLIRLEDDVKREFYIAESVKNLWSKRDLERQINSSLYERLLLSSDKKSVLEVAKNERLPQNPSEIIKDPMVLEFLGLEKKSAYYEKDLESAIISHLQEFILELGNGFSFVSRQKRLHIDGDDFFVDLVFYNRLLQCFVIFEIKTHKLTHQDIGQLQMYVNYFDRVEKQDFENPTIGVLLCADKNDTVVKYTLPQNNQTILASKYQLYLPSEEELVKELYKELREIKMVEGEK
ncbi:MAG: PDDEXK nuclease domain-containing protein [Sulfurimonas sp.]|uniref:PDDEXK nuclease domain-containing protein n=1 Tax=Sulfurimonas sp. TaxID=2022749 RepID=UPI00260DA220|nr:PDDEXK nuclease domain-containing protein [Sulfurimonas sp.]MDD5373079.1 PDDEXK nuclease domain-containing protein [Sulfurimonas sp.]